MGVVYIIRGYFDKISGYSTSLKWHSENAAGDFSLSCDEHK